MPIHRYEHRRICKPEPCGGHSELGARQPRLELVETCLRQATRGLRTPDRPLFRFLPLPSVTEERQLLLAQRRFGGDRTEIGRAHV